jgi:phage replication O-like protein O
VAGRLQRYARIKNEVLELLARGALTFRQTRIALVIIRESWGWNAGRSNWTHRPLTISDIAKRADVNRRDTGREVQAMIERKILQIEKREMGIHYSFNEHESAWQKEDGQGKTPRRGMGKTPQGGVKHPRGEGQNTPPSRGKTPQGEGVKHPGAPLPNLELTPPPGIVKKDLKERSKERSKENASRRSTRTYSEAEKRIVVQVKTKLQEHGATAFERDWHLKQLAMAGTLLKTVTEQDILACLDWALQDQYWGDKVDGLATVQRLMKQWQMKGKKGGLSSAGSKDPDEILGQFFGQRREKVIDVEAQVIDGD